MTAGQGLDRCRSTPRAAVLATILLAGQVATAAHLALVRHAACPADGELIHAGVGAHAHPAGPASIPRHPAVEAARPEEVAHDHGHCLVATNRRRADATRVDAGPWLLAPFAVSSHVSGDVGALAPRLALHRLAPKQSPPALQS